MLNVQKYATHNFLSINFHGQRMNVGLNLALFIFLPQLLTRFGEKDKSKTGILVILLGWNHLLFIGKLNHRCHH